MAQNNTYIKYLSPSAEEEGWGLGVTTVGHAYYPPGAIYPASRHPGTHFFSPEQGRVLNEYQVLYVSDGAGWFRSRSMKPRKIGPGSVLLLFPGEWHSYYPDSATGWREYWIGFKGEHADRVMRSPYFSRSDAVMEIGPSSSVPALFMECISYLQGDMSGCRLAAAGLVRHLLGVIYMKACRNSSAARQSVAVMERARAIMRRSLQHGIHPEDVACELGVGYSWFRQEFRRVVGVSPGQYMKSELMARAKELLASDRSISEIAYDLGFENSGQFSVMFRKREGMSPTEFRRAISPVPPEQYLI